MIVTDLYKDNYLKFEHSEVNNSTVEALNAIGVTDSETLRTLPIIPSNSNSIYVSKSGIDVSNYESLLATMSEADPNLSSSGGEATGYESWRAFDNVDASYWEGTGWESSLFKGMLQYDFGELKTFKYFTLKFPNITPRSYEIMTIDVYGSNDGINFSLLYNVIAANNNWIWTQNELRTYTLANVVIYRYYRFVFQTGSSSNKPWVGELKLYGEEIDLGTTEYPVLSLREAIKRSQLKLNPYIIIKDSGEYEIPQLNLDGYPSGIYAAIGETPTFIASDDPEAFGLNLTGNADINVKTIFTENDDYYRYGVQLLLSNGNYAIIYFKQLKTVVESTSHDVEWRCRIYNYDFTIVLADTLLLTGTGTNHGFPISNGDWHYIPLEDKFVCWVSTASYYRLIVNNDGTLFSSDVQANASTHTIGMAYHGLVDDNIWFWKNSTTNLLVYQNNTLMYTFTGNYYFLYAEYGFGYFYSISSNTGTFYKLNLSTFTIASSIAVTGTGYYTNWWTNWPYIMKYNGRYFALSLASTPQTHFITEINWSTFKVIGNALTFADKFTTLTYPYNYSGSSGGVRECRRLTDRFHLFNYYLNDGYTNKLVFNVLDLKIFTDIKDNFNSPTVDCIVGQTLIPNSFYPYTYNMDRYFQITDDYQLSSRCAGYQTKLFYISMIKITSSAVLNGITFDADEMSYMRNLIESNSDLDIDNCTFKNIFNGPLSIHNFITPVVKATGGNNSIKNTFTQDVSKGFVIDSGNVDFENNIILRSTDGNAVTITGSGANIIFNHNTIFNNYAGLELLSNLGTEIVKNSIFYTNNAFGVKVVSAVHVKNVICTDTLITAILDSTSKNLNPLFYNEGIENPELVDVHLKSQSAGYQLNSPAIELGDDELDAGAYNVEYTLASSSYTELLLPKPKKVNINYTPINFIEVTAQDGTYDTSVDGFQQEITLEYDSIASRFSNGLLKMYLSKGDVRLYINPLSDPFMFETVRMTYKDLPFDTDFYKLNCHGTKGFKLIFVRKFSIEELL